MRSIQSAAHACGGNRCPNMLGLSHLWNRSALRLLVRALPLLLVTCASLSPAHADGVSSAIRNGETVSGTISGKGFDTYTFKVPPGGSSFVISVAETGPHDETFVPTITLTAPDGDVRLRGRPLFTLLRKQHAVEGTWNVRIDQAGRGTVSGGYALTLVQVPSATPAAFGVGVSALSPGVASSGTNSRGKIDVWTFNGSAGHTANVTFNKTGGEGFAPEVAVISPGGTILGGGSSETGASLDISMTESGVYTVVASKGDEHDVTGTYSLTVNNKN